MRKLILFFCFLVITNIYFSLVSCSKDDSDIVNYNYSDWTYVTEADSVIYAKARVAYLEDPANAGSANLKILQFLSANPDAVRTKAAENGTNYQFACKEDYVVTVFKGISDEIGKVIDIEVGCDQSPSRPPIPPLPEPRKRDTIPY